MRRSTLTLLVSALCCIALYVLVLPRESQFGYTYEQGRPWLYSTLIANYDFPIYKSEEQLQADRDSATAYFQPFFQQTDSMAFRQGRHLLADWQEGRYKGIPYAYVAHVGRLMEEIYTYGILANNDMSMLRKGNVEAIRIISGTTASSIATNLTFTPLSAYEYIMQADSIHYKRQELAKMHLNEYLKPNLNYDSLRTQTALDDVLKAVSPTLGMVQSGQKIVDRGDIINEETYTILNSFRRESELRHDDSSNYRYILTGQIGIVCAIFILVLVYLHLYRRDVEQSPHNVALIFALLTVFPVLSALMVRNDFLNVYLLPYAMAPIFIRVFIDSRTAVMQLLSMVLLTSICLHQPYTFTITQLLTGLVAVYSLRELTARAQIFKTALVVTLCSCLLGLFIDFMQGATFATLDLKLIYYKLISGVLLLFTYPLMYLIERMFNFTSDVALIELSNINHPLLSKMSKVAQGTFQHSMQVANLASDVAQAIGAESLLVRTGALYHDIGKMKSPAFFTENQAGQNPHDQLTEEQSAAIIISHVTEGLRLADKYNLPDEIRQFILTHHGTSLVRYFYQQAINRRGEDHVNAADFTYPGRLAHTREQAILTMTDAVEAASRSLKTYTEESIQQLVDRIIDGQLQAGTFKECPISFQDIQKAKKVFCDNLKTIYHTRISYPEDIKQDEDKDKEKPTNKRQSNHLFGLRTSPFGLHKKTRP